MITIAFVFDLNKLTEVGEDVSSDFNVSLGSAIVAGPCSTTWCYPNARTVHITFASEDAAIDWMISEKMEDSEISYHMDECVVK